jgi:hypothetical protein
MSHFDHLASPIRRLPDEILSLIFGWMPPNDINSNRWEDLKFNDDGLAEGWNIPGFTLERVCHRWRRLAISAPALWSNIDVGLFNSDETGDLERLIAQLLRHFLSRSRCHPLDLRVTFLDPESWLQPAWEALVQHRARWKSLAVCFGSDSTVNGLEELQEVLNGPFPILEHLELRGDLEQNFSIVDAPMLTSFREDLENDLLINVPPLQIQELEYVDRLNLPLTDFLSRFPEAKNVTLELERCTNYGQTLFALPPQCRALIITYFYESQEGFVFPRIEAPSSLQELSLWSSWSAEAEDMIWSLCPKFIMQFKSTLTSLNLFAFKGNSDTFLSIVELLPALTTLDVTEYASDSDLKDASSSEPPLLSENTLQRLQEKQTGSFAFSLMPKLTHLRLDVRCEDVSDKDIVDMVLLRALDGLKLFCLHVSDRLIKTADFDKLKPLKSPSFCARVSAAKTSWWTPDGGEVGEYAEMW